MCKPGFVSNSFNSTFDVLAVIYFLKIFVAVNKSIKPYKKCDRADVKSSFETYMGSTSGHLTLRAFQSVI